MAERDFQNVGETLALRCDTRIQLCGRLTVRIRGQRIESALPGRQGRLLLAYLVAHRQRPLPRTELLDAVWPDSLPAAADAALNALLAKLRAAVGSGGIVGKHDVQLLLPADAWIDLEAAREGLHRAESAVSLQDWTGAWGPSRVALHIALRTFLSGYDAEWIDAIRRSVDDVLLRAHECVAVSGLALAGPELASADRSGRALVTLAPYRESGYRLLMQVLAKQGNVAEALLVYESLRQRLREELGANPAPATQALHLRLLEGHGVPHIGGSDSGA